MFYDVSTMLSFDTHVSLELHPLNFDVTSAPCWLLYDLSTHPVLLSISQTAGTSYPLVIAASYGFDPASIFVLRYLACTCMIHHFKTSSGHWCIRLIHSVYHYSEHSGTSLSIGLSLRNTRYTSNLLFKQMNPYIFFTVSHPDRILFMFSADKGPFSCDCD